MAAFQNTEELKIRLRHTGELHVVLDSDREYALHPHDTEMLDEQTVKTEGIPEDGDEYLKVRFPVDAIEHSYAHNEL